MAHQFRGQGGEQHRRDRDTRSPGDDSRQGQERSHSFYGERGGGEPRRGAEADDYGRDFGAPYRGGGYGRDEESGGNSRDYSRGANAVRGYGSNYASRQSNAYDRGSDSGYAGNEGRSGGYEDRGWLDRASDEVSSWFGDRGAEQRRNMDEAKNHRGRGPKGYMRSDERIREEVCDRLSDDPYVDASEIEVSVSGGEVTLSGTADNREERRRAEDCAERVSGVGHVQNNVRVKQGGGAGVGAAAGSAKQSHNASGAASSGSSTGIGSPGGDIFSNGTGAGSTGGNPATGGSIAGGTAQSIGGNSGDR